MDSVAPISTRKVPFVFVAISNVCNLECPMCEPGRASTRRGNMDLELFTRVVADLKRMGVPGIALHNVNEPILHPRIFDVLNHLEDQQVHVFISSNGQALDQFVERARRQERLPRRMDFRYSIEGGTKQTYEEIRRGGSFEKLIANLEIVARFCQERGIRYRPSCNYILTRKTAREVATFYRRFRPFFSPEQISFCFLHGHPVFGVTDFIKANALTPLERPVPCKEPFQSLSVHYDGQVSLCCIDYEQTGIVGDCRQTPLDRIWRGELIETYRAAHNARDVAALPRLCQRCTASTETHRYPELNTRVRELLGDHKRDEEGTNEEIYEFVLGVRPKTLWHRFETCAATG